LTEFETVGSPQHRVGTVLEWDFEMVKIEAFIDGHAGFGTAGGIKQAYDRHATGSV
jgi:hypothetical protein